MAFDPSLLRRIVEGALLAAGEALSVDRLLSIFEEDEAPERQELLATLRAMQEEPNERGFELVEVASGWRYQVCSDLAYWVNRLWEEKPAKYSRALLETLALVAYRQPLTRSDIEQVRGVAVSSHIMRTLVEREWVKVVGHRDVPGRPALFATTRTFLDYFGLSSLEDLPSLNELQDLDGLNQALELETELPEAPEQTASEEDDEAAAETPQLFPPNESPQRGMKNNDE